MGLLFIDRLRDRGARTDVPGNKKGRILLGALLFSLPVQPLRNQKESDGINPCSATDTCGNAFRIVY